MSANNTRGCDPLVRVASLFSQSIAARSSSTLACADRSVLLCDSAGRELLGRYHIYNGAETQAATAHVSQFDPSIRKYRPDWDSVDLQREKDKLRKLATVKGGRVVEAYRISGSFNQE